jgi:hypothetical protein
MSLIVKFYVIAMIARLQPSYFIFFLLKKPFDRIRSTVPIQFSSVFNFHQHPAFLSRDDCDQVCLLDRSSWYLDHLPFPDMGIFMKTLQTKSVNGQRFHHARTVACIASMSVS